MNKITLNALKFRQAADAVKKACDPMSEIRLDIRRDTLQMSVNARDGSDAVGASVPIEWDGDHITVTIDAHRFLSLIGTSTGMELSLEPGEKDLILKMGRSRHKFQASKEHPLSAFSDLGATSALDAKEFIAKLRMAVAFTERRGNPPFNCVQLQADGHRLTITASDKFKASIDSMECSHDPAIALLDANTVRRHLSSITGAAASIKITDTSLYINHSSGIIRITLSDGKLPDIKQVILGTKVDSSFLIEALHLYYGVSIAGVLATENRVSIRVENGVVTFKSSSEYGDSSYVADVSSKHNISFLADSDIFAHMAMACEGLMLIETNDKVARISSDSSPTWMGMFAKMYEK